MSIATKLSELKTIKQDIKTALEEKGQTPSNVFSTYADNIRAIETGGITPSGEIEITENGTYDVTNYASANVNVSGSTGNTLKNLLDLTKSSRYLFAGYRGTANIGDFIQYGDTENVTNMSYMFADCQGIASIPLLNTKKVTNMTYMFSSCIRMKSIPQLNTKKVTDMTSIFYRCCELSSVPQLDTPNVTNFRVMFSYCYKLQTIDLTYMKTTSSSYANEFAYNCYSLTKLIIRNMDTLPVISSNSFSSCYHFTGTKNSTYNPDGLKDGRIYVPDDKVDSLKTATNWSTYADIIVPLSELGE